MAAGNPYLRALARSGRSTPHAQSDAFGGLALTALAAGGRAARQFLQSERGQSLVARFRKSAANDSEYAKERWIKFRNRAEKEKDPVKKAGLQKKADRYAEMMALAKVKNLYASRGVDGDDPIAKGLIIEHRRNVLATEISEGTLSPERKGQLTSLIEIYDKQIAAIKRDAEVMKKAGFGATTFETKDYSRVLPVTTDQALVEGIGGLQFRAQSPPGPARLNRLPMYPSSDANAMSGATGLVNPGDDPWLMMQITQLDATVPLTGAFALGPEYQFSTRQLEYGSYRVVGIQCSFQENYTQKDPAAAYAASVVPVIGVGIAVRSLAVYNGAELLLPINDIPADSFIMMRPQGGTGLRQGVSNLYHIQSPYQFEQRQGSLFMGLRSTPVVDANAHLVMTVQAFATPVVNPFVVTVPLAVNLVCELLTDRVYGDQPNPSPAGRAGALVSLSATRVEQSDTSKTVYDVQNLRWKRPT